MKVLFLIICFYIQSYDSFFSQMNCSDCNVNNYNFDKEPEFIEGFSKFNRLFYNEILDSISFMPSDKGPFINLNFILYINENGIVSFEKLLDSGGKPIPINNQEEMDIMFKRIGTWNPAEKNGKKIGSCYCLKINISIE